jgi:hypothetical protein
MGGVAAFVQIIASGKDALTASLRVDMMELDTTYAAGKTAANNDKPHRITTHLTAVRLLGSRQFHT